jgi:hypothetical protein
VSNHSALAESLGYSELLINYEKYDPMPNMLASNSKFVTNSPKLAQAVVAAMAEAAGMFETQPERVEEILSKVYAAAGYRMDRETTRQASCTDGRESEIRSGLDQYFRAEASNRCWQME